MPGIYLSDPPATETTSIISSSSPAAPAITSVNAPSDFQREINTCGFTSESTITCSFGSECTDVGSYRGCCIAGAADCVSTIYTTCLDYGRATLPGACGNHTLCCPAVMPSCFSYGYISTGDDRPDATLTHVQCHQTAGFGEMFPFPPELLTTTTADAPSNTTGVQVQPIDDSDSSSSGSTGAIVGAVVGAIALLLLIGLAVFLVIRRRRQKAALEEAAGTDMALPPRDKEVDNESSAVSDEQQRPAPGPGRLRPLSTIPEQPPTPISTRPLSANAAGAGAAATTRGERRRSLRRSFGPHWPLGSGNPLASHPVDLEKRLSGPRASTGDSSGIPQIQVPPPPGSKLVPPPPPPPKSSSSQPDTPTSISAGLQSPRLSYIPVSPIDAALFRDNTDRRFNGGGGEGGGAGGDAAAAAAAAASGLGIGVAVARSVSSRSARSVKNNKSSNDRRISTSNHQKQQEKQEQEPVSPIDDDDDDEDSMEEDADSKRLSFVSAPSVIDGDPDLVSPLSQEFNHRHGSEEIPVSPVSVSPAESRRGSVTDR